MNRLRTVSTHKLLAVLSAVVVLIAGAGIAQAALDGGTDAPPRKPLAVAIHQGLTASPVEGVSARIEFENRLLPSGALPHGAGSPLLEGASGRLWLAGDGRFRLELQSQAGDAQLSSDGETVTLYDASGETAYRFTAPAEERDDERAGDHAPPTLEQVRRGLAKLADTWAVTGPGTGALADRPAYEVRIAPKDDGGLLGAATLAWDAEHGVPLEAAVYAEGQDEPVLKLTATDIAYGPISAGTLDVDLPAGTEVIDLAAAPGDAHHGGGRRPSSAVHGLAAVQARLPFALAAPRTLAGLPRRDVLLAGGGGQPAAVVTYGEGLGGIAVIQREAAEGEDPLTGGAGGLQLPRINIDGATGSELATALGTVISFTEDGVAHVVLGSVEPQAAETAARELR